MPKPRINGIRPPEILPENYRDVHYRVARMLAEGLKTTEIAKKTGMSMSRISCYRNDPSFTPLIDIFRAQVQAIDDDLYAQRRAKQELVADLALERMRDGYLSDRPPPHEQARLDFAAMREALDANQPTVNYQIHGNVSQIPLAELVTLQRKRVDQMALLEASAADTSLPDGAVGGEPTTPGPENNILPEPVPAPSPRQD